MTDTHDLRLSEWDPKKARSSVNPVIERDPEMGYIWKMTLGGKEIPRSQWKKYAHIWPELENKNVYGD